ncbi:hypothetical protein ACFPFV_06635 [Salinicoccus siamensis]|uniref:YqzL-like protein n=1 Tax=Salinicoccus siamensis TaxID=381830 RepID=A0ABV5Z3T1_9STAP
MVRNKGRHDGTEYPLQRNEYWYGFLFDMFLESLVLIFRLIVKVFSIL